MKNLGTFKKSAIFMAFLLIFAFSVKANYVFTPMINPDPDHNILNDVAGCDQNHMMSVGQYGTILSGDGVNWTQMASPTANNLWRVRVISPTNAWACGLTATLIHYNGTSWSLVTIPGATEDFFDILFLSANNIWVCGDFGALYHYNGSSWMTVNAGIYNVTYASMSGVSSNDILLISDLNTSPYTGEIIHFDGTSSTVKQTVNGTPGLNAVYSDDNNLYYILGSNGIYKYNKTSNTIALASSSVYGYIGKVGNSLLVCGGNPDISLYDGAATFTNIGSYKAVSFYSPNDPANVYFVGAGNGSGIIHLDMTVGIDEQPGANNHFQAFPNPAIDQINISCKAAGATMAIDLYNNLGQKVAVITEPEKISGEKNVPFNVSDLPRGLYFIIATVGNKSESQKLLIE